MLFLSNALGLGTLRARRLTTVVQDRRGTQRTISCRQGRHFVPPPRYLCGQAGGRRKSTPHQKNEHVPKTRISHTRVRATCVQKVNARLPLLRQKSRAASTLRMSEFTRPASYQGARASAQRPVLVLPFARVYCPRSSRVPSPGMAATAPSSRLSRCHALRPRRRPTRRPGAAWSRRRRAWPGSSCSSPAACTWSPVPSRRARG